MKLRLEGVLVLIMFVIVLCLFALLWELVGMRKDSAMHLQDASVSKGTKYGANGFVIPPPPN